MIVSTGIGRIGLASVATALLVILPAGARSYAQSTPAAAEMSKLRLLYVGHPGSDREKDFVGFLRKYFNVVQTGNLQAFKEADTQGFDVTLLDWDPPVPFDIDKFRLPLSRNFSRPVMTFGFPGGEICRRWRLRTGHS